MRMYESLSLATNDLKARGFDLDFNLAENCLVCAGNSFEIDDFKIVEFYRFEGDSNPDDAAIVYALESNDGHKGVLVTGYGISAEGSAALIALQLKFKGDQTH